MWLVLPLAAAAAPRAVERAPAPHHEFPDKPTGPIVVEHRFSAMPMVGVPLKIAITARAEGVVGAVGIEAHATAPEAVLVTAPVPVDAGERAHAWEITVVPLTEEAGYLNVVVSGAIDGTVQARSITISLRSAPSTEAATVEGVDGEALIALPAEESSH
jgi:hypothetical protein